MRVLTNDGRIEDFNWAITLDDIEDEKPLLSIEEFAQRWQTGGQAGDKEIGLLLEPDTDLSAIRELTHAAPVIAVNFPAFTDGRGFSLARSLRQTYGYQGKLVAVGHFMQDQLFYLKRCGFDAFAVSEDANLESMQRSLKDFSESYQAACDQPQPLFRRVRG